MRWIVGLNGCGKTVFLEQKLNEIVAQGQTAITNLRKVHYKGFDMHRLMLIEDCERFEELFGYAELKALNNRISIVGTDIEFTEEFLDLLTLLCRQGDILILDEPEMGLYGIEIDILTELLNVLKVTYKEGYIATHCQELFSVESENFYWCDDYNIKKIRSDELYEHIGQF